MNENNKGFDLRAMIDNIGETLRSAGTAASDSLRPAMMWTESGLRNAVLTALGSGPMTGHDVIESIHASNDWGIKPASAKVYPLLESLLDEQLVSVSIVKDRKVYTLTKSGKAAEKLVDTAEANWNAPQWPGLRGELTTASRRLARAAFDVSQHGTKEQQAAAAAAIDEARRKINEILAAK
jgi:DNA-binding PadR family transcriptional regulator